MLRARLIVAMALAPVSAAAQDFGVRPVSAPPPAASSPPPGPRNDQQIERLSLLRELNVAVGTDFLTAVYLRELPSAISQRETLQSLGLALPFVSAPGSGPETSPAYALPAGALARLARARADGTASTYEDGVVVAGGCGGTVSIGSFDGDTAEEIETVVLVEGDIIVLGTDC